ncbi:FkbM family methyltransferase [Pantoea sp. Seng]|uniref:FkbM family methyltransferase n=1 Tax=Pantoea sp. Seng TaxID=2576761 RepID=UPI00132AEEBD|nr:FkbM family methyltransferase [Pantoea sp. Seng]MXP52293.1 FkbM family methyltransferase [Pantoea sp. Seng]
MKTNTRKHAITTKTASHAKSEIHRAVDFLSQQPAKTVQITSVLLKSDPNNPLIWVIHGRALEKTGDFYQAEESINKALNIKADYDEALYAKANLLYNRDRLEESELFLVEALPKLTGEASRPLRALLATVLQKLKKYDEAIEMFQKLTEEDPNNWLYWNNLGMIFQDVAKFEEMDVCYLKSCELTKDNPITFFNHIVGSHYNPERNAEQILELCHKWQERFPLEKRSVRATATNKKLNKTLRVGMISDGFRSHPVGNMITIGLSHIPESHIDFYAYSTNFSHDHITDKIQRLCKKWQVISGLNDAAVEKNIIDDEIDILFDLCGYNANSRMQLFQKGVAPIQIKWVGGLISSTGLENMDYLLSDHVETPDGSDVLYTEKLIRLPGDYICYDPPYYMPSISNPPVVDNGYITFGCFNNASKINEPLLGLWAHLMHQVPDSRLFLKSFNFKNESLAESILGTMETLGIARDRIILEGASPHRELLASYNKIDIALDPWPYSGGLTTCEAMAMGVPVVTLPGPTFAGRHSASHLVHAGMAELVAEDAQNYVDIAVGLTKDINSLSVIRQHLRDILLSSPVCDGKAFANGFSDAMRAIWQRHCEGKDPAALSLRGGELPVFADSSTSVTLYHPVVNSNPIIQARNSEFEFKLDGKVIMMDYGSVLTRSGKFMDLTATEAIHCIVMDALGEVEGNDLPFDRKNLQHIKLHMLGDGQDTPVYMCLDGKYSSDLKALASSAKSDGWAANKIITELLVPSSKLDEIHGLNRLDWLVLDNRFNLRNVFAYGETMLKGALLISVNYRFELTHENQMRFDEIMDSMVQRGFVFHSVNSVKNAPPIVMEGHGSFESSQILAMQFLFIPCNERLSSLSFSLREKLAFILHAGYQLHDVAARVLQFSSNERAITYTKEMASVLEKAVATPEIGKKHTLPGKLIVSLTSYPKRFATLHLTLQCLTKQSVRPDRIILWIAESDRSQLPNNVLSYNDKGVEIKYCDDIKSYKKIVPTLVEEANAFIVTADDDLAYKNDWLEKLIGAWDGDYKTVVAYRAHKARLDANGMPVDYKNWEWQYANNVDRSGLIFPTTGFGTLYPPHCFHPDVIDKDIFEKLAPNTDDVWLYWMCRLNGVKFKVVGGRMEIGEWEGTSESALWHSNLLNGQNDKNIGNMISHYGFINDDKVTSADEFCSSTTLFSFSHENRLIYMNLPNQQDFIQNVIKSHRRFYEPEMLADIAARTKPGSTILDIGANIGNHSVYFGLFCNANKVFSFEPQGEVYDTLSKNIKLNFLDSKVTAFQMGLGSYETTAKLGSVDARNIGMTKLEVSESGGIRIATLDSMTKNEPDNSISVIKIDVEGMEMEVLSGAVNTLQRHSPVIYAEAGTEPEFESISVFLAKFGYLPTKRFNATATYLFEKFK